MKRLMQITPQAKVRIRPSKRIIIESLLNLLRIFFNPNIPIEEPAKESMKKRRPSRKSIVPAM